MSSAKSRPHHGHPRTFVKREYFALILLISLVGNRATGPLSKTGFECIVVQDSFKLSVRKRALDPLELEFHVVVSCPVWVLGAEPDPLQEQ